MTLSSSRTKSVWVDRSGVVTLLWDRMAGKSSPVQRISSRMCTGVSMGHQEGCYRQGSGLCKALSWGGVFQLPTPRAGPCTPTTVTTRHGIAWGPLTSRDKEGQSSTELSPALSISSPLLRSPSSACPHCRPLLGLGLLGSSHTWAKEMVNSAPVWWAAGHRPSSLAAHLLPSGFLSPPTPAGNPVRVLWPHLWERARWS